MQWLFLWRELHSQSLHYIWSCSNVNIETIASLFFRSLEISFVRFSLFLSSLPLSRLFGSIDQRLCNFATLLAFSVSSIIYSGKKYEPHRQFVICLVCLFICVEAMKRTATLLLICIIRPFMSHFVYFSLQRQHQKGDKNKHTAIGIVFHFVQTPSAS